ncbi:MAG: arsenite methyltransferase [Saprospiraceae bacterium]|nr:arsenite methyltransferase [Saprospiraceae bacterium]
MNKNSASEIKTMVQEKYAQIALQDKAVNEASCCGVGCCDPADLSGTYTIMSESYAALPGYNPDADLGLGCGLPTEFAHIQPGDTVLDLGSGAGNDCFVARAETGETGKVIGVDFTPAMIKLARQNAEKLGFNNVEFRQGDIEDLPLSDSSVDVVVSNCVLNLVPDKAKVFEEIKRTLRPGGHFSISDVVLLGELPASLITSAEMYAGCVAGALQMEAYLQLIREAGFENILVQKQKPILIPDNILLQYLTAAELDEFRSAKAGIFSITVYAEKPGGTGAKNISREQKPKVKIGEKAACCEPGCCN